MKKHFLHFLLSINLLSVFILSSFSIAKAESLTPATISSYGSYSAETYYSSQSGASVTIGGGVGNFTAGMEIPVYDSSVFHFHYDFDAYYSGSIDFTVVSVRQWRLDACSVAVSGGWFDTLPSKTATNASKTFRISFEGTPYIDFYIIAPNLSSGGVIPFDNSTAFSMSYAGMTSSLNDHQLIDHIDYLLLGMSVTYNDMLLEMQNDLNFDIPLERTSAYSYLLNMGDSIHYDNTCPLPYINLDTSKQGQAWVYGGRTYLFAYAYERSIGSKTFNELFTVSYGNVYNTVANNQSVAPTVSGGFVYDWVEITFNTGYNGWFTLKPNYNCKIVPLYFNLNTNPISNELAEFLHHDPNNITYNQLEQIIEQLVALNNEEHYDTTTYDNFITDVSTFFTNLRNWFPSITPFQTDINSTGPFTGDNTHVDEMTGFVGDVYTGVSQAFPFVKTFIILGAVVLLMKVFL